MLVTPLVVVVRMVGKPHRISTAGDPEKCGVKWEKGVMEDDRSNDMKVEVV